MSNYRLERLACAATLLLALAGCDHRDHLSAFSYLHRPLGYHWVSRTEGSGDIAYVGTDPRSHWTVYVGPDGIYYSFPHSGDIAPRDLTSFWNPHDADDDDF